MNKNNSKGPWPLTTPKSISILALFDPRLIEAHKHAVAKTMDYLEKKYAKARIAEKKDGEDSFTGHIEQGLQIPPTAEAIL